MRFPKTTACVSSLLMVAASASTPTSFEVPGTDSGTAVVPDVPELETTTVYETSTEYLTSPLTVTSAPIANAPANSSVFETSSCTETPPADITPTQSLYVTGSQTFVPVTLWENTTTRVIYPQNSTALEIPTGYPVNGTSTVVITTSVIKTAASTFKNMTSVTASPSATVSEVPTNGAVKVAGDAVLGLGLVAGFMAIL